MTRLTSGGQVRWRPTFQPQGPDSRCVIDGVQLGWDSCTMYAGAMGVDSTTGGAWRPTGCALRRASGDTSGGTTLRQMAEAIHKLYGMFVATYTGSNVLTPSRVAAYLRAGQKVVVQGNAAGMLGTKFQSTAGPVNHAVFINEVRGGTTAEPEEALVYDPAADGRKRSYHVDQGPSWWPWWLVKRFVAALQPNGPGTPVLGSGKVYTAVFPDSEPHVRLRKGAIRSNPLPDRTRSADPDVWVHSTPSTSTASRRYQVPKEGTLMVGYQYADGDEFRGSKRWLGNDTGTEWVHTKRLTHVGGET